VIVSRFSLGGAQLHADEKNEQATCLVMPSTDTCLYFGPVEPEKKALTAQEKKLMFANAQKALKAR
jgi:hypothetical protein